VEKEQNFNCSSGSVSSQPHTGQMPQTIASGKWQRHDGQSWVEDASIVITQTSEPGVAGEQKGKNDVALKRMGLKTALAIGIHNFPEGLATFVATLQDPLVGLTLAIAIAVHNIPEGVCVALPIYYSTGNRHKAFLWALLSGISEPIGALVGLAVIKATGDDLHQIVYGVLFGLVAGMMVAIVALELLPTAQRYDATDRFVTNFLFLGMFIMALSLVLFGY